jgi:phospholipid/cholesterol/gamma-HCH transport system substrate-binding protein
MSASPTRQAVIVGIFVLIGITILAGGILTIGDLRDTFTRKIRVTAVFDQVNGLKQGDNIWFSGVKVGVVRGVSFHDSSQVEVEMLIDNGASQYIRRDALAKISSDGLIGNKIVVLYDGKAEARAIEDGDVLAIGHTVSTEEMMAMLQQNNVNLLAITTDIKGLTAELAAGEGTAGKLLGDDALYAGVMSTVASMGGAAQNAERATASLSTFAATMNQEGGLAYDLVTDTEIYPSLQQTAAQASTLVGGLAQSTANPGTALGTLMHDEAAGADMKAVLDNLNEGTRLLSEDLEAAQHNFLLRGFFKKKEKEERRARESGQSADVEVEP